ncbi:MAG: sodium:solute symporter [Bacteroidetes bacterium 4484_249]|nr:MAG: sodium:solute symporter [Bacteroidetes bacterium 4484_249]
MSPQLVFIVIIAYFSLLIFISWLTSRKSNTASFFTANKQSPWYLVAFGMIGASLSGVTFISVPGWVADTKFYYFQMVLGFLVGYFVIATVLMPLYYRLNLITIYTYLEKRFGFRAYKTGSAFFLLSRIIGSSFRLFLVAGVLQLGFFNAFHIPFWVTVAVTISLIWVYTFRAGIKTIVWTDTLQTFFMITAVIVTVFIIGNKLDLDFNGIINVIKKSDYSTVFDWNWQSKTNFFKQFLAGAFIALVMTGLDQDMMQKNLTCRNIKDAKKNMFWFSITLVPVNLIFLSLGVLLYYYAAQSGIQIPAKSDDLYSFLALNHLSVFAGVVFLLGITAAAFSSADSALTALTTSFSIDFLNLDIHKTNKKTNRKKRFVHIGFSVLLFLVILIFKALNDESVVSAVYKVAGYTYGPILGLFAFGLISKREVKDKAIPFIAVISPILVYFINMFSDTLLFGYKFGFELLIVNGALTYSGLFIFSKRAVVGH